MELLREGSGPQKVSHAFLGGGPSSVLREVQASLAFVERFVNAVRRYLGWEIVFLVYTCVNCLTIALIGVESHDPRRVLYLVIGAVLWGFLSVIFQEVSECIAWERW